MLIPPSHLLQFAETTQITGTGQLKCDGTLAETRFRLSAKRTSPFKLAGASVQSTTGSRSVRISGSNVGYTMFRGSVKSAGYPLHSPVSSSLPRPSVTVCHHIATGVYIGQNIFLDTDFKIQSTLFFTVRHRMLKYTIVSVNTASCISEWLSSAVPSLQ